jgi:hypothetical protein
MTRDMLLVGGADLTGHRALDQAALLMGGGATTGHHELPPQQPLPLAACHLCLIALAALEGH